MGALLGAVQGLLPLVKGSVCSHYTLSMREFLKRYFYQEFLSPLLKGSPSCSFQVLYSYPFFKLNTQSSFVYIFAILQCLYIPHHTRGFLFVALKDHCNTKKHLPQDLRPILIDKGGSWYQMLV